ncbi:MAG: 16S rRNA (cytidine(1402)-2'-O)-methyltransferase [Pseudomonadota bacterium]
MASGLWLVATPIGNAEDITLRALEVLAQAEILACEDTRRLRKLMAMHGIDRAGRELIAYNDQNGPQRRPVLMDHLRAGRSVAYTSDAGTPLIADPGYRLVNAAQDAEVPVHTVPGPSAVMAALTLAGLPTDRFLFLGFLPIKVGQRRRELDAVSSIEATLVIYESGKRVGKTLQDLSSVFGGNRDAAIVREVTKLHEETRRATLFDLATEIGPDQTLRGEIVIVIGPPANVSHGLEDIDTLLLDRLGSMSLRDAAVEVASITGHPRREIYARALSLSASD